MQHAPVCRPGAAEFPHDNPRIDFGVIWLGSELCQTGDQRGAAASTEREATIDAGPPRPSPVESTPELPLEGTAAFLRAAVEVAVAHGGSEHVHELELLLGESDADFVLVPSPFLSERAKNALIEGKILEWSEQGLRTTPSFVHLRRAWLGALRGDSHDLSACGDSTLDVFAADVVARLLGDPGRMAAVRRDLRRRGVAAFGML